ncbi:hypothetical protein DM806_07490 [Sphingobium lactosutens]|nr:hypothetical protein [Sphingobium lactosutens]
MLGSDMMKLGTKMTPLDRLKYLPDWPARMTAPVAAAYMGVSPTTFLTRFRHFGIKEGGNLLWARLQLDRKRGIPRTCSVE